MNTAVTLRPYEPADADALVSIYREGVQRLGPRAYRPEQVAAWLSIAPQAPDLHRAYTDGRFAIVAEAANGAAVGFADIAPNGHIQFLYVDPDHAGQGLGRTMVRRLLDHAHKLKIESIYSDASELARPIFERAGFKCIAKQEHEIAGTIIHNYHMGTRGPDPGKTTYLRASRD